MSNYWNNADETPLPSSGLRLRANLTPSDTQGWLREIRSRLEAEGVAQRPMVYLGIVDLQNAVRAEAMRPGVELRAKNHHRVLGLGKRWTYFQNTRWVVWSWEQPTLEDQGLVSHFLQQRGLPVVRHQLNLSAE
jgi:hypothetical protein